MLTRSLLPRKRFSVIAVAVSIIVVFITISNLRHRSSELATDLRLSSHEEDSPAEQEAGK